MKTSKLVRLAVEVVAIVWLVCFGLISTPMDVERATIAVGLVVLVLVLDFFSRE